MGDCCCDNEEIDDGDIDGEYVELEAAELLLNKRCCCPKHVKFCC